MAFLKKSKNTQEKMAAIDARVLELSNKKAGKEKDIEEKKGDIAKLLGILALEDDAKVQESLKLARKSLERLTENYNDISEQITLLSGQRKGLEKDLLEAELRELPGKAEETADEFNKLLAQALDTVNVLQDLHKTMLEKEKHFHSLRLQYGENSSKLGITEPLNLSKGLGELFDKPSPFSMVFQCGPFDKFLNTLLWYKSKIGAFDPELCKQLAQVKYSEPYTWAPMGNPRF